MIRYRENRGRMPKRVAPPSLRPAPAFLTPPAADAAIALMDRLGLQLRAAGEQLAISDNSTAADGRGTEGVRND